VSERGLLSHLIGLERRSAFRLALAAVLCALGGGCAFLPSPLPAVSPTGAFGVPLLTHPPGMQGCAGVELGGQIFLVATVEGVVGQSAAGPVLKIYWPPGFQAIFDPDFKAVVDSDGAVIASAGDEINGLVSRGRWNGRTACATGDSIYVT
jgi:hypothetical protein